IVAVGANGGAAVRPDVVEPIVFVPPTAVGPVVAGGKLSLEVHGGGSGKISYDWQRDGVSLGVDGPVLDLGNLTTAESGNYSVILTNGAGSTLTGMNKPIDVLPTPPHFTYRNSAAWEEADGLPEMRSIAFG